MANSLRSMTTLLSMTNFLSDQFNIFHQGLFFLFLVSNENKNQEYTNIILLKQSIEMQNQSKISKTSKKSKPSHSPAKTKSSFKRSRMDNADGNTSQNTRRKVVEFLMKAAELQRKLEIIKQALCEVPSFTPASLFHRFDADRKNYIIQKDIQDFLIESNIEFKGSQLKTLFGRIDTNKSQTISQRQFQNFILPNQDPKLRYETVRRPVVIPRPHEKLCKQIQYFVSKFFTKIIKDYAILADINATLKSSYDFNSQKIFDLLSGGSGHVTGQSIKQFMLQNDGQLTNQQIGCLIKTMDKKGVAKVNIQDFNNFLATMGLKKAHQIFDELSPIPALKDFSQDYILQAIRDRENTLKQRYKDNKSYVKGMDEDGRHILGYSRVLDPTVSQSRSWLSNDSRRVS